MERSQRRWMVLPAVINAFCCTADIFEADLVFGFSRSNHFFRGPLGWLPFATAFIYLVVFAIQSVRHHSEGKRTLHFTMVYITVTVSASILLETTDVLSAVNTVGMLALLLYMNYLSISGRYAVEKRLLSSDNDRLASEKALVDNKVQLLQQQIHRHFIYNSMVALKSLCRRDPEKAEIFVQDLSDYLRVNMESMTRERYVEFAKEQEYIRQYLAIEQVDPTSRFRVEWDVRKDDFVLPALSVEPLVENAVQHGVADPDINGYIRISTREEEEYYVVEVEDNGFGFCDGTVGGPDAGAKHTVGGPDVRAVGAGSGPDARAERTVGGPDTRAKRSESLGEPKGLANGIGTMSGDPDAHGPMTLEEKRGIGIANTRLRLAAVGGKLTISSDGYGTIARVEVPKNLYDIRENNHSEI